MPKKKKEKKVEKKVEKAPKKSKIESITILSPTGNVIRTYTDELHSDKKKSFIEKAREYAKRINGSTREA